MDLFSDFDGTISRSTEREVFPAESFPAWQTLQTGIFFSSLFSKTNILNEHFCMK